MSVFLYCIELNTIKSKIDTFTGSIINVILVVWCIYNTTELWITIIHVVSSVWSKWQVYECYYYGIYILHLKCLIYSLMWVAFN